MHERQVVLIGRAPESGRAKTCLTATRHENERVFANEAERLVGEEARRLGWSDGDWASRPKGDPGKVAAARRLRQESTMSLKWMAQRL